MQNSFNCMLLHIILIRAQPEKLEITPGNNLNMANVP
jgi:hypothetical protein